MRVATWNLERRATPDRLELIQAQDLDLLLAQEVTTAAYEDLRRSGSFDWSSFSLDHRPRLARNSRSERLGVAVFGRRPIHLRASGILPWLMRPEKFVLAELDVPGWKERGVRRELSRLARRREHDRTRPLEWVAGGGTYSLLGLAAHICASAGVEFPGSPPGPHWWRAADGRTLVALSDGV